MKSISNQDVKPVAPAVVEAAGGAVEGAVEGSRNGRQPAVAGTPGLRRRLAWAAAGLVAVWTACVAVHAVRLDWLLLLVVIFGTAAVMDRAGALADRLVLALMVLAGATCATALVFSVWPWHLHPVALAGTALTVLVLLCAVLGRTPRLPWPLGRTDLLVGGPAALFALLMTWPYLTRSLPERFALLTLGEDRQRHFMIYDSIRLAGGYLFFRRNDSVVPAGWVLPSDRTYPAGAHMIAAVLDNFVTSTTVPGSATDAFSRFVLYDIAAYCMLFTVAVWAARRLAGPVARLATFSPLAVLIGCYLLFGDVFSGWKFGFTPQLVGMTFFLFIIGLAARPLASARQQIVAVAMATAGLAFTYYLLVPLVVVPVLLHAWKHRLRLLPQWPVLLVVGVGTLVVAPIPRLKNASDQGWQLLILPFGIRTVEFGHVGLLLALFVLVLIGSRRWSSALRSMTVSLGTVVGATAALGVVQLHYTGRLVYFFDKMLYCVIVTALVALGAAVPLLGRLGASLDGRRRIATVLAAGLVAAAVTGGLDVRPGADDGGSGWARDYLRGNHDGKAVARLAYRIHVDTPDDGRGMLVYATGGFSTNVVQLLGNLRRDRSLSWAVYLWTYKAKTPDDFVGIIAAVSQRHFRIVTDDVAVLDRMHRLQAERPDLGLDVVDLRTLPY